MIYAVIVRISSTTHGMVVCQELWNQYTGYETSTEYVDFYENKYRMKRKSVYHRKYHINNVLTDLRFKI